MTALFFNKKTEFIDALGGIEPGEFLIVGFEVEPFDVICRMRPKKNVVCQTTDFIKQWAKKPDKIFFVPFPAVAQFVTGERRSHISQKFIDDCNEQSLEKYYERPVLAVLEFGKKLVEVEECKEQFPDAFLFLPPLSVLSRPEFLSFLLLDDVHNIDNYYSRARNSPEFFSEQYAARVWGSFI